ncbi:DUF2164 domain-containing protein [Paenibacillus sp. J22TS3]|uniref:DUF2164 domain-containing protein n=1 Tax=Paenibacillus sp. J22TS3 TaxID=2807192 RepID=UPI001B2B277D|nr:DUF2164 domain-containing protein [Paenibacillus sp. J22TS3]GIP23728.1 hypothetical protein J22TS3_40030 [Paenibacillus sp. J22TS3]
MLQIKLPKEDKDVIIRSVQTYFEEERGESIGELAAEQLIDFMIGELGPAVYNKAIEDARKVIYEKNSQVDDELYALQKPVQRR